MTTRKHFMSSINDYSIKSITNEIEKESLNNDFEDEDIPGDRLYHFRLLRLCEFNHSLSLLKTQAQGEDVKSRIFDQKKIDYALNSNKNSIGKHSADDEGMGDARSYKHRRGEDDEPQKTR
ncbi:hypothetical protein RIR_jg40894.t1 [Rhizophagus irregularis DAOM 181602=DAOM 197198]|nr:hypothetical protein RIR_jg40894.t1 [Rhizophagus irregularis DAOM 181602=DAOM 197198]CAG8696735.1 8710_t:CDS:2 [Rhizophagus irregularis]